MGKGNGVFGNFSGKVGNVVGFKVKSSNGTARQGLRAYQPDVANPQTERQALQRSKLAAVTSFYRAAKSIVSRGFEGVPYGAMSYREFLRQNLTGVPVVLVERGSSLPYPSEFVIARGSLVPITTLPGSDVETGAYDNNVLTDIFVPVTFNATTIGQMSTGIISSNTDMQAGDQLTFIAVVEYGNYSGIVLRSYSVILDPNNTQLISSLGGGFSVRWGGAPDGGNGLNYGITLGSDENIIASAVIHSRDGETEHLRSDAKLALAEVYANLFQSGSAAFAAIRSFMKSANGTIDWPVSKIDGTPLYGVGVKVTADMVPTEAASVVGSVVEGFITDSGQTGLLLDENRHLVLWTDGAVLTYGESNTPVTLATTYTGLALTWAEMEERYPDFEI